jgi:hypothetical protein
LAIEQLESLYGNKEMTFTAHAHIHLAQQVERFGPLHKISAFSFESLLKKLKSSITGPTNIGQQISNRFCIEQIANDKLNNTNYSKEFLLFIEKIINDPTKSQHDLLYAPLNCAQDFNEICMINAFFGKEIDINFIRFMGKCLINKNTFYSKMIEEGMKRCSSYAQYETNGTIKYGRIIKFVKISNRYLFFVDELQDVIDTIAFLNISSDYSSIFQANHFTEYFKVFSKQKRSNAFMKLAH